MSHGEPLPPPHDLAEAIAYYRYGQKEGAP